MGICDRRVVVTVIFCVHNVLFQFVTRIIFAACTLFLDRMPVWGFLGCLDSWSLNRVRKSWNFHAVITFESRDSFSVLVQPSNNAHRGNFSHLTIFFPQFYDRRGIK